MCVHVCVCGNKVYYFNKESLGTASEIEIKIEQSTTKTKDKNRTT